LAGNEAPPFWYEKPGWLAGMLAPASWAYGAAARFRMDRARPPQVRAPVLCIGNLTVGGSGKTPAAIAVGKAAIAAGYKPGFLTRGYGGTHRAPHMVDLAHDTARSVGDEPLLLARHAPTVVGGDRAAGAQMLVANAIDFVIMDDGFQSRSVHYDFALITIDARRGVGNGAVLPAGPLRAPLIDQMRHASAVLRIGAGTAADGIVRAAAKAAKPIMQASLVPSGLEPLVGKPLFAFTGIGDPEKFYDTLTGGGCWLSARRSFGDHHQFTVRDAEELLERARSDGLLLVTTEKDAVRLSRSDGPLGELRKRIHVVTVDLQFENADAVRTLLRSVSDHYDDRRIGKL
jgi:tetraacyldisaccharide 4'-kinase